jgi:curved DNA-binding protein CbpA
MQCRAGRGRENVTVDAYSVLGLEPGASGADVTAAYRRLAKEWHPDVHGTEAAVRRMALINAAYDELRSGTGVRHGAGTERAEPSSDAAVDPRGFVGRELLSALREGEPVRWFCAVTTWNSPTAFLVVSDTRLLWLLDDAVTHRVRSLAFAQIASVRMSTGRVRRRSRLRVQTRHGRRLDFGELEPGTASAIAAFVRGARA